MRKLNEKMHETRVGEIPMIVKNGGSPDEVRKAARLAVLLHEHTDTVTEKTKSRLFAGSNEEPL